MLTGLLILPPLVASLSAKEEGNLFPNGDLEDTKKITTDNLPHPMKPWVSIPDKEVAKFSLSWTEKTSGSNSLCIERVDTAGEARVSLSGGYGGVDLEAGKPYTFTCQVKATSGTAQIFMSCHAIDSTNKGQQVKNPEIPVHYETETQGAKIPKSMPNCVNFDLAHAEYPKDFNKLKVTFTAPDQPTTFHVTVGYCSGVVGFLWFDDFSLVAEETK